MLRGSVLTSCQVESQDYDLRPHQKLERRSCLAGNDNLVPQSGRHNICAATGDSDVTVALLNAWGFVLRLRARREHITLAQFEISG